MASLVEPYPLLCAPLLVERVWGGRRLARLYDKPLPVGVPVGEAWEVADLDEGTSGIAAGPLEGYSLREVTEAWGPTLVGTAWPEGRFPLLVKLLDANDDLSVQVHPSADDCARWFPTAASKDEAWVVVDAEPGAAVYYGFQPGVTQAQFEAALEAESLLGLLARVEVRPGDVLRVAPGTVHALGRGVAVLEVQEPSDTTYRLYDYGRGRALYIDEGRRVARVEADPEPLLAPRPVEHDWGVWELLVDAPAYRMERLAAEEALAWAVDPRSVQVVCLLEGTASLAWAGGEQRLAAGDTVVVPAAMGSVELRPWGACVAVVAGAGGQRLVDPRAKESDDV